MGPLRHDPALFQDCFFTEVVSKSPEEQATRHSSVLAGLVGLCGPEVQIMQICRLCEYHLAPGDWVIGNLLRPVYDLCNLPPCFFSAPSQLI